MNSFGGRIKNVWSDRSPKETSEVPTKNMALS